MIDWGELDVIDKVLDADDERWGADVGVGVWVGQWWCASPTLG